MLYVIVADNKAARGEHSAQVIAQFSESEVITLDDTMLSLADLEQFLYPSLFSTDVPIVHGRFLLADVEIEKEFAASLAASPTVFMFEELALPAATVTMLKKAGATVHVGEKQKRTAPADDLFAATACITAKDKKSRWLAYRSAVEKQPIEAILGILYWKLRTLAAQGSAGNSYEKLYGQMLEAQAKAWRSGAPLDALIEKVILEQ
jgi:hypothetical protein